MTIHPIPFGTRDVLPDELRELRAITDAVRATCEARGYGEVATPALEYEDVLLRGDASAAAPAYRLFDEQGNVLVLRSDMTIPIARVVATRFASEPVPLRFWYSQTAHRAVRAGRGQAREILQAGIELVGAPAPEGTAEALTVLAESLTAIGLRDFRIGLGDAALYRDLLLESGIDADRSKPVLHELATRDLVGVQREVEALRLPDAEAERLLRVPQLRGGPEVLDEAGEAGAGLRRVVELLGADVRERVILDLGLLRSLGYYTGSVFEVYDPEVGVPIGGGGRYDDLLGRFGRSLPAVGWALDCERVHRALYGERR